jgi:hypothetical protein
MLRLLTLLILTLLTLMFAKVLKREGEVNRHKITLNN